MESDADREKREFFNALGRRGRFRVDRSNETFDPPLPPPREEVFEPDVQKDEMEGGQMSEMDEFFANMKDMLSERSAKRDKAKKGNFRFNNQKIMLTYKTHIDKKKLIAFLNDWGSPCKFIRVAHESGDVHHPYLHTHVLIDYGVAKDTTSCSKWDWNDGTMEKSIHPNMKLVKTIAHWNNSMKYLAKEDPENADLLTFSTLSFAEKIEKVVASKSDLDAFLTATKFSDIAGISIIRKAMVKKPIKKRTIEVLRPWQRYILDIMNGPINSRKINWIFDKKGGAGKSSLKKYLCNMYEGKCMWFKSASAPKDMATTVEGWMENNFEGDTIIIDLPRQKQNQDGFYASLECFCDGEWTTTKYRGRSFETPDCNIFVFANFLPMVKQMSMDRWNIIRLYEINTDGEEKWLWERLDAYTILNEEDNTEGYEEAEINDERWRR